jgi:predicted CoA-substrate-specific enzyme activase
MKLFCGIDVGSAATKAVLIHDTLEVQGRGLCPSGADFSAAARTVFDQALAAAGAGEADVDAVVSTGYGRTNVEFATGRRTEIDCHARGAYHHFKKAITVVDIGGQDNKIIQLDAAGKRLKFTLNRKCSAGTGAFLEEMALRLNVPIDRLSKMAESSTDPAVSIGSYCTVFAMTEILSKVRAGVKAEDLARAAMVSVAKRVLETQAIVTDIVATGGVVAHNPIMKEILKQILKCEVHIPPHPQHIGAFGAALVAASEQKE